MPGRQEADREAASISCRRQHLDPNNVELGILTVIAPHPGNYQNPEQSIAMCRAVNDWQVAEWAEKDARLKGVDPHRL